MTPTEQRIAFAKHFGWTNIEQHYDDLRGVAPEQWAKKHDDIFGSGLYWLPDAEDLNVIHEAVMKCRESLSGYSAALRAIVRNECPYGDDLDYYFATAAQRLEALIKTLNLWKQ